MYSRPLHNATKRARKAATLARHGAVDAKSLRDLRENYRFIQSRERTLRAVLEGAPVLLFAADAAGTITLFEGSGLNVAELDAETMAGRRLCDIDGAFTEVAVHAQRSLLGEMVSCDVQLARLRLHTKIQPMRDGAGNLTGIIGVCFNVTERVAAEERFRVLFERSSDAHFIFDEGGIIDCNEEAVRLLRCSSKKQLLSLHPAMLSPEFQPDGQRSLVKSIEVDGIACREGFNRFEWTHKKMDGEDFPAEVTLTPVTLEDRMVMLVVWHDLTEVKKSEELIREHAVALEFQKRELERANAELASLATTDGLTGLKNHRAFQERLAQEAARSARYGMPLSLILLDVDHFKQFNDAFGHPEGDTLLKALAQILQECSRDADMVARYGGEEFAVILPQTDVASASVLAERVRWAVCANRWPTRPVTASLGVAGLRCGEDTGANLISRADAALYQAKGMGRNRVCMESGDEPSQSRYPHSVAASPLDTTSSPVLSS